MVRGAANGWICTAGADDRGGGSDALLRYVDAQLHSFDAAYSDAAEVEQAAGVVDLGDVVRAVGTVLGDRGSVELDGLIRWSIAAGVGTAAASERHQAPSTTSRPRKPRWSRTRRYCGRFGQDVDLSERRVLDALDHQLSDAIAALKRHRLLGVMIDEHHLEARRGTRRRWFGCVDDSDAEPARESGTRMDERGVPLGQRNGESGRNECALTGARSTSTVVTRSAPASPGWAYTGSGTSGSRRRTWISMGFTG